MSSVRTAVLLSTGGMKHQNKNHLTPECTEKTKTTTSNYKTLTQKNSLPKIPSCTIVSMNFDQENMAFEDDKKLVRIENEEYSPKNTTINLNSTGGSIKQNKKGVPLVSPSRSKEALYTCPSSMTLGDAHTVDPFCEIPKTHMKLVYVTINLEGNDWLSQEKKLDLVMSSNLVIRSINKCSVAFHQLIVGDQIRLSIVRPWNIKSASEKRMGSVKKLDCCSYLVIIFHKIKNLRNGFEVKLVNKQCHVVRIDNNTRGAYAFLKGDRLLDVDRIPVTRSVDLHFIRRRFDKVMASKNRCTFLIERPLGLRSTPNPSCFASKTGLELDMGEDATEIGCREAMRHSLLKDKYRIISILRDMNTNFKLTMDPIVTAEDDVQRQKRKKKSRDRVPIKKLSVELRTQHEIMSVPSDVKNESQLQKVTSKSGLVGFVRNYIHK